MGRVSAVIGGILPDGRSDIVTKRRAGRRRHGASAPCSLPTSSARRRVSSSSIRVYWPSSEPVRALEAAR